MSELRTNSTLNHKASTSMSKGKYSLFSLSLSLSLFLPRLSLLYSMWRVVTDHEGQSSTTLNTNQLMASLITGSYTALVGVCDLSSHYLASHKNALCPHLMVQLNGERRGLFVGHTHTYADTETFFSSSFSHHLEH